MFFNSQKSTITKALKTCDAVANGDFEARITDITEKGEAAELCHAINRLIDRSDAYIRETRASLEYVSENKYFRRISLRGMTGAFGEAAGIANNAMDGMQERVGGFRKIVGQFDEKMTAALKTVEASAVELETSAQTMGNLTKSANDQAQTVEQEATRASENVNSVAASTEEMTQSIGEITQQVTQSADITLDAVKEVEKTSLDISSLSEASEKIGLVVSMITDIAEQTNLLALNATIEAARAGDAGKGFAVVAAEVKELASQTAKATDEIGTQISAIQEASNKAVASIGDIGTTINSVNEIANAIAASVVEQSTATEEISRSVVQASEGTSAVTTNISTIAEAIGETMHAVESVQSSSGELSQSGNTMRTEVTEFLQEVQRVI